LEAIFTQNERAEWPGITMGCGAGPACDLCLIVPLLYDTYIARSGCLQIIVSCVQLSTAVEGKLVFWDMTPCNRSRLYPASRRNLRPSSTVICLAYRGRMFLRNIGIYLHGAWFDCLEECSLWSSECAVDGDSTFIQHLVIYLQTMWQHFSGDSDLFVPTFMFLNQDTVHAFVWMCFTYKRWTVNRVL